MTLWEPGDPDVEPVEADEGSADQQATTWRVGELGAAVRSALQERFPGQVWVRGEIRNLRAANRNGHRYFDLVEADPEPGSRPTASIPVALFAQSRARVNATLREAGGATQMSDGIEIRVRGELSWWVAGGQLRFVMSAIDPSFTLGQLELARARLLSLLREEGLLTRNGSLPLSPVPLRVGLITSLGSAAHADTMHELDHSGYAFRVHSQDARMQGVDAPATVAAALERLAHHELDVILLVRGGGARTDLVAFDSEVVARAIATCPIPVFCGIGHEVDHSVADEVCHTSAKTPTACAALLVDHVRAAEEDLNRRWQLASRRVSAALDVARRNLEQAAQRGARTARVTLRRASDAERAASWRTTTVVRHSLTAARTKSDDTQRRLALAPARTLRQADRHIDGLDQAWQILDPARFLAQGWSVTRTADGALVRAPEDAPPGTLLHTTLANGTLTSRVELPAPSVSEDR